MIFSKTISTRGGNAHHLPLIFPSSAHHRPITCPSPAHHGDGTVMSVTTPCIGVIVLQVVQYVISVSHKRLLIGILWQVILYHIYYILYHLLMISFKTWNNRRESPSTISASQSPRFTIPKVIEEIDQSIISKLQTNSLQSIANLAKSSFINQYNDNCNIVNCYICTDVNPRESNSTEF